MSNVFFAINGDDVGEQIGSHIANDDHESLARVSESLKTAHDMVERWVESKGGKVIVSSGDEGIFTVPKQAMAELKSIQNKYSQLSGVTATIGVGSSMSEASKALIFGKMNDKNQIVHYDPSIDSQISGEDDDLADDSQGEIPSPDNLEQDGMDNALEESGLADDPEAAGIEDSSGIEDDGNGDEDNNEDEFLDEAEVGLEQEEQEEQEDEGSFGEDDEQDVAQDEFLDEEEGLPEDDQSQFEGEEDQLPEDEFADEEQEFDPSQPPHEQDMSDEENFAHDAEENEDDEQDSDNIEADEESEAFGGNTEPEDSDFAEDAVEDVAAQDIDGESQEFEDEGQEQEFEDPETMDMDNDGDVDFEDDDMQDDAMQELSQEDVAQDGDEFSQDGSELPPEDMEEAPQGEEDQDGSVMTDMLHANIGDEESEDSDDEVKQDVIESLMSFKQNKQHLEELKQTNPEMYQANIMMLRAMIQMAKKLKMNPDASMGEQDDIAAANEQFPSANPNEVEEDDSEELPDLNAKANKPFGKSEIMKSSRADRDVSASARHNRRAKTPVGEKQIGVHTPVAATEAKERSSGTSKAGLQAKKNPDLAISSHKKVLSEIKQIKPNLPKSEVMKARVDEGHSEAAKKYLRQDRKVDQKPKGVHSPNKSYPEKQGQSEVGSFVRGDKRKSIPGMRIPKSRPDSLKDIKETHHKMISEQRQMPKPNLPKSEKDSVKGVHRQSPSKLDRLGTSEIGALVREGNSIKQDSKTGHNQAQRKQVGQNAIEGAKGFHREHLAQQRQMPKPNLPKSESDSVSSFKQGDRVAHNVHGAGTVAGSHGQGIHSVNFDSVSDRNTKPTKVHEKNFQQKQKSVQKSEKPKVEQMNLDLKKQGKKPVKKQ